MHALSLMMVPAGENRDGDLVLVRSNRQDRESGGGQAEVHKYIHLVDIDPLPRHGGCNIRFIAGVAGETTSISLPSTIAAEFFHRDLSRGNAAFSYVSSRTT